LRRLYLAKRLSKVHNPTGGYIQRNLILVKNPLNGDMAKIYVKMREYDRMEGVSV
jgi:hypothetical protein